MGPGGVAIADAISKSTSIRMLDISFNSICGNGKNELPKDDDEQNKKVNKKVNTKVFNNDLAGFFYEEYSEHWAKMFKINKSLVHVDMSHNHIKEIDCEIIAEGLKSNHNVLGLHFVGNQAHINHLGFMIKGIPMYIGQDIMISRMQKQVQGGVNKDR